MKKVINFLLLNFLFSVSIMAQCFDPDPIIWLDTWASCEKKPKSKTGIWKHPLDTI